jgi:predicted permease
MKLWSRIRSALRNLFRKQQVESRLDDELRAYVEMVIDEKIAAGMSPSEARRTALAEIGGIEQVKQSVRDHRAGTAIELLWQDARYALRQLRRNPAFTITAVLTLGLGIGATTSIFSAVYALLLRPLPYPEANRLVYLSSRFPAWYSEGTMDPDFTAAQEGTKSFEQFAGYRWTNSNLTGAGDPVRIDWVGVTANFLPMLGVHPQLGRNFSSNEDRLDGPPVILLSHRLWESQFHSDPKVLGKAVTVNGKVQTIIGVLPAHFSFPSLTLEPDVYGPMDIDRDTSVAIEKRVFGIYTIARLRSGVSQRQAQAEVQTFFQARMRMYPALIATSLAGRQMIVEPLQRHLTGDDRKPLYILLVCVAAVLLIACANVANLQLARAVSRRHETTLRGALGASRLRLIRQFLVESLILSSLAAVLGLLIALTVTSLIRYAGTPGTSPTAVHSRAAQLLRLPLGKLSASIQLDGWVLAFTVGLALLTTVFFGLAPAISGTRTNLRNALQTAALRMSTGREQRLLRHSLLVLEVGLAVVLLSSAGLLVHSFVNVMRFDSGFDPENVLTGTTLLHGLRWGDTTLRRNFAEELLSRLQALPGVKAAALTSALPLGGVDGDAFSFEDNPNPPMGARKVAANIHISPDYFHTIGTRLLRGRVFDVHDTATSARVVIVSRAFEKQYLAGDALRKRFSIGQSAGSRFQFIPSTVVGVVEDVRHNGLEQNVQPEFYVPIAQDPALEVNIVLRSRIDPSSLAGAMRKAVTTVNPEQPLYDIETMNERVSGVIAQRRFIMLLIACFAMLAVVLSAVGVYGVFAYSVSQRTQEMGIRLALGASRGGLLRLIVMQAARLIVVGGVLGMAAALLLSRLLASMLVGVRPHDPLSFALAWALMTIIALLASTVPASNAARTDLISVLHTK